MNDELISVIIPAYNAEKTIVRAIDSVLQQTYKNIEIIVINDGSTDGTELLVKKFKKAVKSVTTSNFGVSHARNVGIDLCSGTYLMFLDADDELLPDAVEVLLNCSINNNLDIIHGKNIRVADNKQYKLSSGDTCGLIIYENEDAVKQAIYDMYETHSSCAKLYKKKSISGCKFPEDKRCHEDSFFVFLCLLRGIRFGVIDKNVSVFHTVPGSASREKFSEKHYDILELAEKKYSLLCDKYPQFKDIGINILIKAHMAFLKCTLSGNKIAVAENRSIRFIKENAKWFVANGCYDSKFFFIIKNGLYNLYKLFSYHK